MVFVFAFLDPWSSSRRRRRRRREKEGGAEKGLRVHGSNLVCLCFLSFFFASLIFRVFFDSIGQRAIHCGSKAVTARICSVKLARLPCNKWSPPLTCNPSTSHSFAVGVFALWRLRRSHRNIRRLKPLTQCTVILLLGKCRLVDLMI